MTIAQAISGIFFGVTGGVVAGSISAAMSFYRKQRRDPKVSRGELAAEMAFAAGVIILLSLVMFGIDWALFSVISVRAH